MCQPIGLFDSGIGGLTVLRALRALLPNQDLIYVADTAMFPYGLRSRANVQRLSYRLTGFLIGQGARVVVAACNTAAGSLFPEAREDFSVPILGPILPAAKEAVIKHGGKRVGVLASPGTIKGGYYQQALGDLDAGIGVVVQEAPRLVEMVEEGQFTGEEVTRVIQDYLAVFLGKVDALILGCTHFPFLLPAIRAVLPPEIHIIDPASALAQEVVYLLEEDGLTSDEGSGVCQFWSTRRKGLSKASLGHMQRDLSLSLDFSSLRI